MGKFKPNDVVYFSGSNGVIIGTTVLSVIITLDGKTEHILNGWAGRFQEKDLFRSPNDLKTSRYGILDRLTDALGNSDGMTPDEIRDELREEGIQVDEIERYLDELRSQLSGDKQSQAYEDGILATMGPVARALMPSCKNKN